MSTWQRAVVLCSWPVRAGMAMVFGVRKSYVIESLVKTCIISQCFSRRYAFFNSFWTDTQKLSNYPLETAATCCRSTPQWQQLTDHQTEFSSIAKHTVTSKKQGCQHIYLSQEGHCTLLTVNMAINTVYINRIWFLKLRLKMTVCNYAVESWYSLSHYCNYC